MQDDRGFSVYFPALTIDDVLAHTMECTRSYCDSHFIFNGLQPDKNLTLIDYNKYTDWDSLVSWELDLHSGDFSNWYGLDEQSGVNITQIANNQSLVEAGGTDIPLFESGVFTVVQSPSRSQTNNIVIFRHSSESVLWRDVTLSLKPCGGSCTACPP